VVSRAKAGLFFTSDTITPRLQNAPQFLDKAMAATTKVYEGRIESRARMNAPWQDQTGNARNGLKAKSGKSAEGWHIVLFHRVSYGFWLEVANEGKFQIIMPTLRQALPLVLSTLRLILQRLPK
jgi:hypothetical protein